MQITAKVFWCKFEKLRDKYRPEQGQEWSVDATNLSKETKLSLKAAGVLARVKNKMDDREDFLHFTVSEYQRPRRVKTDGTYELWDFDKGSLQDAFNQGYTAKKNDPIPFFKADGKTLWDFKTDGLIGNGSVADFKFNVSAPNVYLVAVRIREHVPYDAPNRGTEDPNDWGSPITPASQTKTKTTSRVMTELDDEVPF